MPQAQEEEAGGKIHILREWKIGHYRGVTEGAKEKNQDA